MERVAYEHLSFSFLNNDDYSSSGVINLYPLP